MHVFISDLHMTDANVGGAVTDEHLATFVGRLQEIAAQRQTRIKLVFVGDILELLRSRRWDALWDQHQSAPWSGMGPGFVNFAAGHAERCAVDVAEEIRGRYTQFAASLENAVRAKAIETHYVYGNHDYMVQLSPRLREIVVSLLCLEHDPSRQFTDTYSDQEASILAVHGHSYDPVNWHREAEGYWALGDAIVLRVVNRFATEACNALGLASGTSLGRAVHDIDSVEPISDIPLYIRWVGETLLAGRAQKTTFEKTWRRVVDEFLAIDVFSDTSGYGAAPYQRLRQAFALSTHLKWAEFLSDFAKLFSREGVDYCAKADNLRITGGKRQRFVLFGHTHDPMLVPLDKSGDETAFYVNTGCWRRVVTRSRSQAAGPFIARRLASHFVVDARPIITRTERYHLYQEWHAI